MNIQKISFLLLGFVAFLSAKAQPSLQKMQVKLAAEKQNTGNSFYKFELNAKMPSQGGILFSADVAVQKSTLQNWLADKLELRQGVDAFRNRMEPVAYKGSNISKLQQYFKGIKVEHGVVSVVDISGSVRLLQLEFYSLPDNLPLQPIISEATALTKAMEFTGASEFVWQKPSAAFWNYQKPQGELVIVEDIFNVEKGTLCLAYKFDVFAAEPASRQNIYVNVLNGKVVFADATIKHLDGKQSSGNEGIRKHPSNILHQTPDSKNLKQFSATPMHGNSIAPTVFDSATGFLKYSFDQKFLTEKVSSTLYRLRAQSEFPNTVVYETYNINHKTLVNAINSDITDFTDNDNDWNEPEYSDDTTNAALDIHWGIEQIIKYWRDVHNRNSIDNNFSTIKNYFHYGIRYGGAFWSSQAKSMFYGDGSQDSLGFNALASIDVTGHEVAHGVCDFTAALVYKRESGALNEGFSDIWGACIDNYINNNFVTLNKTPFKIADEIVETPGRDCLRDMQQPKRWAQPDCYKDTAHKWFDVNVENCPIPIGPGNAGYNDDCGVHANSGVLNKWFYLITEGDTMTNMYNEFYTVDSLGFDKSERIAYYTEMILTPNSGYEAARIASMNAVQILAASPNTLGITLADTAIVATAWRAVGVTTDSIYNMANTPIFASNSFNAIEVGRYGYIWAGTANNGLYKYNGRVWQKAPNLTNHNISQILPDRDGGIWIAQFGRTGAQAILGGIGYYQDTSFTYVQYSESDGLPTRNVRGVFVNNSINVTPAQKLKRIWGACFADLTVGISRPGSVVFGKETPAPPISFNKQKNGVNQNNGFCLGIGGNKNEIWVFASSNSTTGGGQILRYRTVDSVYLGFIDNTNQPAFSAGFNVKAIYYDTVMRRWWIGLTTGGLVVLDSASNTWSPINFPDAFPAGTIINNNAITGDTRGNIYMGTSNGYVFFGSVNASVATNPLDPTQYKRYTTAEGLPSNNVKGVAVDYRASRVLLATDNGIAFRHIICTECVNTGPIFSVMPGSWSNPGIWASGQVPGLTSNVVVRHPVTVTQNANCNSLKLAPGGNVNMSAGVQLNIEAQNYNSNLCH